MANPPPASTSASPNVRWFLGAVWLILSVNLGCAVGLFQPNVLTWDQWDFFAPLFNGGGWRDLFTYQHGPHRQGAGFVVTSWILELTRWDARFDSLWIASLLSVASALALRLKGKITGTLRIIDAWIPIVGLTLGQFEAILIAPNASHSAFALALLMAVANAWMAPNIAIRYLAAGFGAVGLTFTGFGLFAGVITTVILGVSTLRELYQRRWKPAALGMIGFGVALAGWAWFCFDYQFVPAVVGFRFPWTPVTEYFQFIPLMLLQPTGVSGASAINYAMGGLLAMLITFVAIAVTWKWIRNAESSPRHEVILLLVGAGSLFVCNTAVGRVCLGITAGMSSRYVTLMFPLWLGVYFYAATSNHRIFRGFTVIAMWGIALWPYRDMPSRRVTRWPGTIGATNAQFAYYEQYTSNKTAWVDTYLRTGSIEAAQQARGPAVYPHPPGTKMEEKLAFLKTRELLFFAPGQTFLPYFLTTRTIWNDEFPSSMEPRGLDDAIRLSFVTNQSGLAEITISTSENPGNRGGRIEVEYEGKVRTLELPRLPAVVTFPVQMGFNRFVFRRAAENGAGEDSPRLVIGVPQLGSTSSAGTIAF